MSFPQLVLVAHRRAPVQRVLRTNLEVDSVTVSTVATATECLVLLRSARVSALVIDADLMRDTAPDGLSLRAYLMDCAVPTLLLSWDPCDRTLARELGGVPFITRLDDIERVSATVRGLLVGTPAS